MTTQTTQVVGTWANLLLKIQNHVQRGSDPSNQELNRYWSQSAPPSILKTIGLPAFTGLGHAIELAIAYLQGLKSTFNGNTPRPAGLSLLQTRLNQLVLHHGINTLPEELFIMILEFSNMESDEAGDGVDPIILSHVSRRFRKRALNTPSLWTSVASDDSEPRLKTFLECSRNEALRVTLSLSPQRNKLPALLQDNAWRWKALDVLIDTNHVLFGWLYTLRHVYETVPRLDLPLLHTLKLRYLPPLASEDDEDIIAYKHFYSRWNMPHLTGIHACNVIPRTELASSEDLTYFRQSFPDHLSPDWKALHIFLSSAHRLTHIHLLLTGITPQNFSVTNPIELPNLVSLVVAIFEECPQDLIEQFVVALETPILSELTVTISSLDTLLNDRVGCFFTSTNPRISVRTLIIRIKPFELPFGGIDDGYSDSGDDEVRYKLVLPFHQLQHIQHLVLELPDVLPPNIPFRPSHAFPQLRTLTLKNCYFFGIASVRNFATRLHVDRGWETFEKLEVDGCVRIGEDEVLKVFPRDKVIWREWSDSGQELPEMFKIKYQTLRDIEFEIY